LRIRIKCKKCKFELELDLYPGASKAFNPRQGKGKFKLDKSSLDRLLGKVQGATKDELEKLGLEIDIDEWEDAVRRMELRNFLKENLRISKELVETRGEKYVITTRPWRPGDPFKDVSLPASEIKSFGIEDLRLIPGVTLQTKEYGVMKGRSEERLKGVKFVVILDTSGSMISSQYNFVGGPKIEMALKIAKEIYEFCKQLNYEYSLALFSDRAFRVRKDRLKLFFTDKYERASYRVWNGGTRLELGLSQFQNNEYKDANVVIVSDMDIADLRETRAKIKEISQLTNSFKIILVELKSNFSGKRLKEAKSLFVDSQVKILPVII